MAYIPTIHTLEDDINENHFIDENSNVNTNINSINNNFKSPILVEEKENSITKKILSFISVLLILCSLFIIGYYLYNKYKKVEKVAPIITTQNTENNENTNIQNDLEKILPKLAPGISPYIENIIKKENIIILTIKDKTIDTDNFSLLYSYILAHKGYLNSDLFYTFKIDDIASKIEEENNEKDIATTSKKISSSSTLEKIGKIINENIEKFTSSIMEPKIIPYTELQWESKTLRNMDFEVANAGVVTLIYGYIDEKYLVVTLYLNDYFETIESLK